MNKLVEIRITDANESIRRIEDALGKAIKRRSKAQTLEEVVRTLIEQSGWPDQIDALIRQCKRVMRSNGQNVQISGTFVANAEIALTQLKDQLDSIWNSASELTEYRFNRSQLETHQTKTSKLLQNNVLRLEQIQGDANLSKRTPKQLLREIEEAKPFWEEHIEAVAGMVLRDESFDDGLCALADGIVKVCAYAPIDTLNILGRDHTILKDLKYTVYFRFPIWSVWGLPLTAHEVWHALYQESDTFKFRFKDMPRALRVWNEPLVQDCLADAFATFVIGPAYAFACILLLLDAESPQDRVRAETVFATLEFLSQGEDSKAARKNKWYSFLPGLETCWREAGGLSTSDTSNATSCLLGRDCHLADELLTAYWAHKTNQHIEGHPPDASTALLGMSCPLAEGENPCSMKDATLIAEMRDTLLQSLPTKLRYSEETWSAVGGSLESYLKGDLDTIDTKEMDLRHILHAGWLRRWEVKEQAADRVDHLATKVTSLCHRAMERRQGPSFLPDINGAGPN